MTGTVYIVGAGPGAPDLLTVRAVRVLQSADIVFHDALVHPEVISLAVQAEKVAVGKRCGRHSTAQKFINKRLIDAARIYATVVRLKGGDPMLFGRAQEEIDALRVAGVGVEVVPGVTAALAASAELGVAPTRRGEARSLAFVTPRLAPGASDNHWVRSVMSADTAALYMAAGEAELIAQALIEAGKPASTPVVVVESASLPSSHSVATTLAGLAEAVRSLKGGPALILVGNVYRSLLAADVGSPAHVLRRALPR